MVKWERVILSYNTLYALAFRGGMVITFEITLWFAMSVRPLGS